MFNKDEVMRKIISYIYVYTLRNGKSPTISEIANYIGIITEECVKEIIDEMLKKNYINEKLELTTDGRKLIKVGLIGGVFDILHKGHLFTLRKAKEKVDVLVAVIARNTTVKKFKGREAIMDEKDRREIIDSIKYVDLAILGDEQDFMKPVKLIKPDVIFLGYDQELPPSTSGKIPQDKIIRLSECIGNIKTSGIINRIKRLKL